MAVSDEPNKQTRSVQIRLYDIDVQIHLVLNVHTRMLRTLESSNALIVSVTFSNPPAPVNALLEEL